MNKIIITEWNGKVLTAWQANDRIVQLSFDDKEEGSILNHIYIGKVKNIAKNIGAAFVEFDDGKVGYYNLTESHIHLFANGRIVPSDDPSVRLRPGDEIIVQVIREAVKTKAPVLTGDLSFTGRYCVLTLGNKKVGFSAKISDGPWKNALKPKLEEALLQMAGPDGTAFPDVGIIVRTNAYEAGEEALFSELSSLKETCLSLLSDAKYRVCGSRVDKNYPSYISVLRDSYAGEAEEVVTDSREIWEELKAYAADRPQDGSVSLRFYEDPLLPLIKVYNLEGALEKALSSRVWLKSGGYLVIEPTEALTVIDVNTGKYIGKNTPAETIFRINMEAAAEIAVQLRLRNLSGIIIVDFIDMDREEDKERLLKYLRDLCRKDHVKTVVVDITPLNLVEITRKKTKRPLYEQAGRGRKGAAL